MQLKRVKRSIKRLVRKIVPDRVAPTPPPPVPAEPETFDLAVGDATDSPEGPVRPPEPGSLLPVLIPGLVARTGTTLVMQLLGTSPQIAFERAYPFETRYLSYFFYWARMLKWCSAPTPTWNSETMNHPGEFQGDFKAIYPFPRKDSTLLCTAAGEEPLWARCFRAGWPEFSRVVAANMRRQTGSPLPVLYYAEKVGNIAAFWTARHLLGARAIHTVRDPRDVVVSMIALNRKRGYCSMGPRPDESVGDYVRRRAPDWKKRLRTVIDLTNSPQNQLDYVLRYENLMTDMPAATHRLGQWLGVELDAAAVQGAHEIRDAHMTSRSANATTGRWRTELDADTNRIFVDHLGEELTALRYELS